MLIGKRDISRNSTVPIGATQPLGCSQPFHFNTRPTKHRQPQEGVEDRGSERPMDELSDGSATGYFSDKGTYKGRPSDPPAPIEDRPLVHPSTVTVTVLNSPDREMGRL